MDETSDIQLTDKWKQITNGGEDEAVLIQVRSGAVFLRKSVTEPDANSACHPIYGFVSVSSSTPVWLRAAVTGLVTVS